jgi:fumarate hydratase class II
MIYSEKYSQLIKSARTHIDNTDNVSVGGDLWTAYSELVQAGKDIEAAQELLLEVSKVAFERVMGGKK